MAISPMTFPVLSFEESNPFLKGVKVGGDLSEQLMKNLERSIALQYADANQRAQLAAQQEKAPQMAAQTRNILEGDLPYRQAQTRNVLEGELPYRQAETEKTRLLTPLEASAQEFKLRNPLLSMAGPAGQIGALSYLTEQDRNKLTALPTKNTGLTGEQIPESSYDRLATAIQSVRPGAVQRTQTAQSQQGGFADMLRDAIAADNLSKNARSSYYANPFVQMRGVINSPALQSLAATNPEVAKNLANTLAGGISQGGQEPLTERDYSEFQKNLADNLYRKNNTAQIMNQRQYAGILDSLFDRGATLIPDVAQYAGLANQGKKGVDALRSAFGETSPTYQNYLLFSRSLSPLLANEMRRTLGGQASDKEQQAMNNLANPNWIDSNPQQALMQYQFLSDVYRSSVNPALASRPTDTLSNLKGTDIRGNDRQPANNSGSNMVKMISSSGAVGYIPANRVDEAIKTGKFKRG